MTPERWLWPFIDLGFLLSEPPPLLAGASPTRNTRAGRPQQCRFHRGLGATGTTCPSGRSSARTGSRVRQTRSSKRLRPCPANSPKRPVPADHPLSSGVLVPSVGRFPHRTRPSMFGHSRSFLDNDPAFVPGRAQCANGGLVWCLQDGSSDPPRPPPSTTRR